MDDRDRTAGPDRLSLSARGGATRVCGGEFAGDEGRGRYGGPRVTRMAWEG
jgi:hypothetical protein